MHYLVAVTLAFTLFFYSQGQANEVEVGVGLVCNTPDEVRDFALKFDGDSEATLQQVNSKENVCGVLSVAYVKQSVVGTVQTKNGLAEIVSILVVAVNLGMGWVRAPPTEQFSLFLIEGRSA